MQKQRFYARAFIKAHAPAQSIGLLLFVHHDALQPLLRQLPLVNLQRTVMQPHNGDGACCAAEITAEYLLLDGPNGKKPAHCGQSAALLLERGCWRHLYSYTNFF